MDTNVLFNKIKGSDESVASALEEAGLSTDAELQLLTQGDLHELLPGLKNIKRRKQISDIIHKQKPINVVMEELRAFIPDEHLRAALTTNGVLVNYLNVLKDLKTQMNKVQDFLDAHISLLEEFSNSQPPQDQDKGSSSSTSLASGSMEDHNSQTKQTTNPPETAQSRRSSSSSLSKTLAASILGHLQKTQVTYKMVVSGRTFDAHKQLLEKVKASSGEPDLILEECQSNQECQVIIVFCPVVSRIGTDADTALRNVEGSEPVILVFMHHVRAAKSVASVRTWDTPCNVVLYVHVFYHEMEPGLLPCQENNVAIAQIRKELMSRGVKTTENTSGNAENENKYNLISKLKNIF